MLKNKSRKLFVFLAIAILLSLTLVVNTGSAFVSQNVTSWFWTSDTTVAATAAGDVNGDGQTEIVTGGSYNDGIRWNAQLIVWNASTLIAERVMFWYWTADTQISSVAIANITGGSALDIVTGGAYFDGTRWNAQLMIWNGSTLAVERVMTWYWTGNTGISSVAVANITGGSGLDIVTGGAYFDGTRWNAQLITWNGATLAVEKIMTWYWTGNTYINSVAVGNVTGGSSLSVVTGGAYFDGTRYNSQLIVWNANTLAWQNGMVWYWVSDTEIRSLAVANITRGPALDIVTGGSYFDGTRYNSQLIVWNGASLAWENGITWYWTSNTTINSLTVGNFTGGANLDVVTAGTYNDGVRTYAQLIDWDGVAVGVKSLSTWFSNSDTAANSVAIANFGFGNRVAVGGSAFDTLRSTGQLSIWG